MPVLVIGGKHVFPAMPDGALLSNFPNLDLTTCNDKCLTAKDMLTHNMLLLSWQHIISCFDLAFVSACGYACSVIDLLCAA